MLPRCLLDAGFLPFSRTDLRFLVPERVIWQVRCLHFGVLGDPGTILTLGSRRKDTLKHGLGFVLIFGGFRGAHLESFLGTFGFSAELWVSIWMSGTGKPCIRHWRYCKKCFLQKFDLSCCQGPFFMIQGGLGTNFHDPWRPV